MDKLVQYATNSGDLVRLNVSTANRITINFSAYQELCEHLLAKTKFMVDKFTGLVPTRLIDEVSLDSKPGSVYWLEKELFHQIFNKLDLPYAELNEKTMVTLETLNRIMPAIAYIIFEEWTPANLFLEFALSHYSYPSKEASNVPADLTNEQSLAQRTEGVPVASALPMIRDSFMVYSTTTKTFTPSFSPTGSHPLLFNPNESSTPFRDGPTPATPELGQLNNGIVQQYNILISRYLNDLYDPQSRKMYTKGFATFASSGLLDAMNGNSFPDFARFQFPQYDVIRNHGPNWNVENPTTVANYWEYIRSLYENTQTPAAVAQEVMRRHYELPRHRGVLSSTLAYVMKTMTSRVHPQSGIKLHEVINLQSIGSHILEKYRACIPMHLRIFRAFLRRCRFYEKVISHVKTSNATLSTTITKTFKIGPGTGEAKVVEIDTDAFTVFANPITDDAIWATNNHSEIVGGYLDEIINGLTALIQDITALQTELQETDSTGVVFFDLRKDFTKTFLTNEKELPFAAPSVLAMGLGAKRIATRPYFLGGSNQINNKFAYGIRSVLLTDFNLSLSNNGTTPYFTKLVNDFNAISDKNYDLDTVKYDTLRHVGQALNYLYDLRFYNGVTSFTASDALWNQTVVTAPAVLMLYQEQIASSDSLALVENINFPESRNKIADYLKSKINIPARAALLPPSGTLPTNPRQQVMVLNLLEMNIMPINVHALMRDIPLFNIYNYAMTFDEYVDRTLPKAVGPGPAKTLDSSFKIFLKNPYHHTLIFPINLSAGSENFRFLDAIIHNDYTVDGSAIATTHVNNAKYVARSIERFNTKIIRDLTFLVAAQILIKENVKTQLEFINTRMVKNTNAASNTIIEVKRDTANNDVTDSLFEF